MSDSLVRFPPIGERAMRRQRGLSAGRSISVQVRGNSVCVNRNLTDPVQLRKFQKSNGSIPKRKTIYIYAFPISSAAVPHLEEAKFHKTNDPELRLNLSERDLVVRRFEELVLVRDQHWASRMIGDAAKYQMISSQIVEPMLNDHICGAARLIHQVAKLLDESELNEAVRQFEVWELEQILQATARVKRRVAFTGLKERQIDVNYFKKRDDQILLYGESSGLEEGRKKGNKRYFQRSDFDIENQRMTSPGDSTVDD